MKKGSTSIVVFLIIIVVILAVGITLKISNTDKLGLNDNAVGVATGEINTQGYVGIKIEPKTTEGVG